MKMVRWGFIAALFGAVALSATIRTFTVGDVIQPSDLNANFTHIHNTMVGGHGGRLVDADVNSAAAIAHSKMATPGVLPKSTFIIGSGITPCSAGTCTVTGTAGITPSSVVYNSAGNYTVTIPARANAVYSVQLTSQYCASACTCSLQTGVSTTAFTVQCYNMSAAATNAVVGVTIMDDTN